MKTKWLDRVLAVVLAVCLVVGMMPATALATSAGTDGISTVSEDTSPTDDTEGGDTAAYVAQIGDDKYSTLAEAVKAVPTDGTATTITLLDSIYLEELVTITAGKNVTLDLNGQAITVSQTNGRSLYAIVNNGTFTLTDSSTDKAGSITARGVENYGTMYMQGGTIASCDSNGGGSAIWNEGTLEMTGGTLKFTGKPNDSDNAGSPFTNDGNGTATATITGGTLESPYTSIFVNSGTVKVENISLSTETDYWMAVKVTGGEADLSNVTINADKGGCIEVAGGTAVLEGCTFTQGTVGEPAYDSSAVSVSNDGTVTVKSGNYSAGAYGAYVFNSGGTINIEGGTFTAPTVLRADDSTSSSASSVINVSGGDFNGGITIGTNSTLEVSGGTFKDVDGAANTAVKQYVAEGFDYDSTTGTVTSNSAVTYVAQVGTDQYATLSAAIEAAQAGDTVTLLTDILLDPTAIDNQNSMSLEPFITIDKNLTLDLSGHSIKLDQTKLSAEMPYTPAIFEIQSTVTITGDGLIDAEAGNNCSYGINVYGGSLTIESGTFTGAPTAVQVQTGSLTITGGSFDLANTIKVAAADEYAKYIINAIDANWKDKTAQISIAGGTFGYDYFSCPSESTGTYVADGYEMVRNDDGTYGVQVAKVAQVKDADGNVVDSYETLAEAINAATDGQTVQLLADTTETESILLFDGRSITLDLGGNTLTGQVKVSHGTLTVENGTVSNPNGIAIVTFGSQTDQANYSVVNIASTAKVDSLYSIFVCGYGNSSATEGYGTVVNIDGTVTGVIFVSGNLGHSAESAVNMMASQNPATINVKSNANITGATSGDSLSQGIAMNGYVVVNVESGAVITGSEAIGVKSGVLNITGGTFNGTGAKKDPAEANNSGTEDTGAAISVTSTYNKYSIIDVNISGGTFTSENNAALYVGHSTNSTSGNTANAYVKGVEISIEGGSFTGGTGVDAVYIADAIDDDANTYTQKVISGGEFSSKVSEKYCAEGFEPTTEPNNDGKYTVQAVKVAQVKDAEGKVTQYATLDEAINAVQPGDTITLLANVTLVDDTPAKIMDKGTADSPITLDLNGYTISGSNSKRETTETTTTPGGILWVYGSYVTLTDTSTSEEKGGIINTYEGSSGGLGLVVRSTESNVGAVTISGGVRIDVTASTASVSYTRAIHFQNNTNTSGTLTLTIEDAKVTANKGYTVYASGSNSMVTINGGEFASTGKANNAVNFYGSSTNMTIKGGTFYNWSNTDWNEVAKDHVICIAQPEGSDAFTVTVAEQAPDNYVALVDSTDVYRAICLTEGSDLYVIHNVQTPAGRTIHVKKSVSYTFPDGTYYGYNASDDPGSYLLTLDLAEGVTLSGSMNLYSADITVTGEGALSSDFAWTPAEGYEMTATGENGLYSCRLTTGAQAELIKADGTTVLYKTVVGAITAARLSPGSTAKMLADYTNSLAVTVNKYNGVVADFTLDLNGHTYTYSGVTQAITVNDGAKLIVTDSSENGGGAIVTESTRGNANAAIATTGTGGTIIIEEGVTVKNLVLLDAPNSKLTVAGTIDTTGFETYAISGNGSTGKGGTEITIKATAEITSDPNVAAPAIYHPQSGTLTVEGGEISGYGGIQMCSGDLVITDDPTITATGSDDTANKTGDGGIPDGAAISIVDRNYPGGTPTVEITGNPTVTAAENVEAVQAYTWSNSEKSEWAEAGDSVNISGGTYSTKPEETLLATGYVANVKEMETGYVVELGGEAFNTETKTYGTLAEMLTAAKSGETVQLLTDVTAESAVSVGNGVTLDLNGHNLTISGTEGMLVVQATGVLVDSVADKASDSTTGGVLTVPSGNDSFTQLGSGALPIKVGADESAGTVSYRLYSYTFKALGTTGETAQRVTFWFQLLLENPYGLNHLAGDTHGVSISAEVAVGGETATFVYANDVMTGAWTVVQNNGNQASKALYLTVTGLDSFAGQVLTVTPKLEAESALFTDTATDPEAKLSYTIPNEETKEDET